MKTIKSLATLTLCILSAFGTSIVVNTQQAKAEKGCSNRSLHGVYAFQGGGYLNNTDPYAISASNTYDGNGKITGTILVRSIAGNVTTNINTQGTYQINSDCSVTVSFVRSDGTTSNYSGFVFDDANKVEYTQTDPGTIVNLKGERIKNYDPSH